MRGSASVEMLLVLMVAIYMAAVVYRGVIAAEFQFAEDEYKVTMARLAADKIVSAVYFIHGSAPGTSKKVEIFLPKDVVLSCSKDHNYMVVEVNTIRKYDVCNDTNTCAKWIDPKPECNSNWSLVGPAKAIIIMEKIGENRIIIGEPV